MDERPFVPDRWLLCSGRIHRAVVERANAERRAADPPDQTLLELRLDSGLIEALPLAQLQPRVGALQALAPHTLHIVVETLADAEVDVLLALAQRCVAAELRLHVWLDSPIDAIDSMRAPEASVLGAWRALLEGSPSRRWQLHASVTGPWLARYRAALRLWMVQAREDHDERFDALYPQRPFGWHEFELESADAAVRRYVHREFALLALALEPGQPGVPQGLLVQAPAALLRTLTLHSVPANAQQYSRSQQAAGARRGPPGRTLAWNGVVDGHAFEIVMQLPSKVGRELSVRVSLSQPLAEPIELVELELAGEPPLRMALANPTPWTHEGNTSRTLAFVTLTPELQTALDRVEPPALSVTLLHKHVTA